MAPVGASDVISSSAYGMANNVSNSSNTVAMDISSNDSNTIVTAQHPLTEGQVTSLFRWIDSIPLSRPKKNFTRDFSDGCLCAEVVRHYYPKSVDLHNYPSANSVAQKVYNWNTLNFKVLRKLGCLLSDESIQAISACQLGHVEVLLLTLMDKLSTMTDGQQQQMQYALPSEYPSQQQLKQNDRILQPQDQHPSSLYHPHVSNTSLLNIAATIQSQSLPNEPNYQMSQISRNNSINTALYQHSQQNTHNDHVQSRLPMAKHNDGLTNKNPDSNAIRSKPAKAGTKIQRRSQPQQTTTTTYGVTKKVIQPTRPSVLSSTSPSYLTNHTSPATTSLPYIYSSTTGNHPVQQPSTIQGGYRTTHTNASIQPLQSTPSFPRLGSMDGGNKEAVISGLKDTIEIMQEKIEKLETLLSLKDRRIEELIMRVNGEADTLARYHKGQSMSH